MLLAHRIRQDVVRFCSGIGQVALGANFETVTAPETLDLVGWCVHNILCVEATMQPVDMTSESIPEVAVILARTVQSV